MLSQRVLIADGRARMEAMESPSSKRLRKRLRLARISGMRRQGWALVEGRD